MKTLKTGMKVKITKYLEGSKTEQLWRLDESGFMLRMQGRVLPIHSVINSEKIRMKCEDNLATYLFHSDDLEPVEIKKAKPINFKFDPDNLDI